MTLRLTLIAATSLLMMAPALAQDSAAPSPRTAAPEKVVEGATPDRVAQIERCQGHKFDSLVEIDPVRKRSTRVKLCANPGSSDADWVKTLEAAVAQIEQRDMPAAAKEKLVGDLRSEIAKFAKASKPAMPAQGAPFNLGGDAGTAGALISPTERYETSTLPPLPPRKVAPTATGAIASQATRPMSIQLKCLARRESGPGATCDFFDRNTVLAVRAVAGLEDGGLLRFRRRGEAAGEATLAPMQAGQSTRVGLPAELCRGVASSKVEIELLSPKSAGAVAARLGPFGLRC